MTHFTMILEAADQRAELQTEGDLMSLQEMIMVGERAAVMTNSRTLLYLDPWIFRAVLSDPTSGNRSQTGIYSKLLIYSMI